MSPRVALPLVVLAILIAGVHGMYKAPKAAASWRVIDGDTLQVDGTIVQLYGIDAPELGQLCESDGNLWHCGVDAALALRKLIDLSEASFHCSPWRGASATEGPTSYVCEVRDKDVALVMLHGGYSLALPNSFPDYLEAEEQAKQARLGLWHSDFVPPWTWREGVASAARPSDAVRNCNVKGLSDGRGQRVYYVPTDPEYDAISLDPANGDVLFCSDEEARRAGWRRAGERPDSNAHQREWGSENHQGE